MVAMMQTRRRAMRVPLNKGLKWRPIDNSYQSWDLAYSVQLGELWFRLLSSRKPAHLSFKRARLSRFMRYRDFLWNNIIGQKHSQLPFDTTCLYFYTQQLDIKNNPAMKFTWIAVLAVVSTALAAPVAEPEPVPEPAPEAEPGYGNYPPPKGGYGNYPPPKGGYGNYPPPKGGYGNYPPPKGGYQTY